MFRSYFFSAVLLSVATIPCRSSSLVDTEYEDVCSRPYGKAKTTDISIRSKRNGTGHWVTVFDSYQEPGNSTELLDLDLKQIVVQCGGKEVVHVRGTLGGVNKTKNAGVRQESSGVLVKSENVIKDKIRFHSRHGKNVAVSSDGTTASRLNPGTTCCNAGVITHRLLRQNELFEVRLDNVTKRTGGSINMGVTTYHPNNMVFIRDIVDTRNGMWMFWGTKVVVDGVIVNENFGRDIQKLRSGDLLGVCKKANGELHLYVNGVDQGVAATSLPHTVYGILEVRGDTYQVSISQDSSTILT